VSITGSSRRALRGIGVDSLQAVVHALKVVEIELKARERERKGRFEWLGESWHGMPAFEVAPAHAQLRGSNKRQNTRTSHARDSAPRTDERQRVVRTRAKRAPHRER
jgi:hypothetical protein